MRTEKEIVDMLVQIADCYPMKKIGVHSLIHAKAQKIYVENNGRFG